MFILIVILLYNVILIILLMQPPALSVRPFDRLFKTGLSVHHFHLQVDLLLQHLREDPRRNVKVVCLQELNRLACRAAHLFSNQHSLVSAQLNNEFDLFLFWIFALVYTF